MAPKVEKITAVPNLELGEAPHWDADTQSLYFVDVYKETIHRYVPSSNEYYQAAVGLKVSAIVPVKGQKQKFLLVSQKRLVTVTWDGQSPNVSNLTEISMLDKEKQDTILNDSKCDAHGRIWMGTYHQDTFDPTKTYVPRGSLYKLDANKKLKEQFTPVGGSNGLTWSLDNKKMYFIDSKEGTITQFDFDLNTGTTSNPSILISTKEANIQGFFDGMTTDTEGNIWVAIFNNFEMAKIDTKKPNNVLETVKVPAKNPTSAIFGGKNLDELYVTSSCWDFGNFLRGPEDGALYKVTGVGKGLKCVST